jgi:xylulokinase
MADIYEIPIQRPSLLSEATSFGAALAGGIGVGIYKDSSLAEALTPIVDETQPNPELADLYGKLYGIFNRAYAAFEPLYTEIASFYVISRRIGRLSLTRVNTASASDACLKTGA